MRRSGRLHYRPMTESGAETGVIPAVPARRVAPAQLWITVRGRRNLHSSHFRNDDDASRASDGQPCSGGLWATGGVVGAGGGRCNARPQADRPPAVHTIAASGELHGLSTAKAARRVGKLTSLAPRSCDFLHADHLFLARDRFLTDRLVRGRNSAP